LISAAGFKKYSSDVSFPDSKVKASSDRKWTWHYSRTEGSWDNSCIVLKLTAPSGTKQKLTQTTKKQALILWCYIFSIMGLYYWISLFFMQDLRWVDVTQCLEFCFCQSQNKRIISMQNGAVVRYEK